MVESTEAARLDGLLAAHRRSHGSDAVFLARAPGRVNLIGEHTDYNGLPVMPIAIDRDIWIAGTPRADGMVRIVSEGGFDLRSFSIAEDIPPYPPGDWGNYAKAAAQGLRRHIGARLSIGAELTVHSTLPAGAGLSSSAALVVANALALLFANRVAIDGAELAELLPRAERYVGTMSGGMDQTISLLGQAGHALRIDFFPVRWQPVPIPDDARFVIAHSLVSAEKSGGAKEAYNRRVIECGLATACLHQLTGAAVPWVRLADAFDDSADARLRKLELLHATFGDDPVEIATIQRQTGLSDRHLEQLGAAPGTVYAITRRTRHVFSEAARVATAQDALACGDLQQFGRLMNESHLSCEQDYEISCDELNELVTLARRAGALGARLTGAGFGGCIVALVRHRDLANLREQLRMHYYAPRGALSNFDSVCLPVTAVAGASVRPLGLSA